MPGKAAFPWRQMRYLAFVLVALAGSAGCAGPSPAAVPAAVTSAVPAAVTSAATSPERAVVLSGDAVGPVRFGEPEHEAVTALTKLIGITQGGVQSAKGNCTIDAALYWTSFSVYFLAGRFVGYQTGNNLTAKPEPTFNGNTPRGLRIDDSLAEARMLYPGNVTTRAENGGVYAITTATGTIRGYLSMEISNPPGKIKPDKIKIASISAGSVGCPAASPG
jgi:hypothetical protein